MATSSLWFLPWLRAGLTGAITAPDGPAGLTNRALVPLAVQLNKTDVKVPKAAVLGPGDVLGIDARQVLRLDPPDLTTGHETRRWPSVEFDEPALPWLFTPAAPAANRLRPWIALVVVREQDGVELTPGAQPGATRLRVAAPANVANELGDPARAWAYAHVQVTGSASGRPKLDEVLSTSPEQVLSRLVCARPLAAASSYLACVVPTFAAGRIAGLGGRPLAADGPLGLAWDPGGTEVELPVYVFWRFTTAAEDDGDFATLARRLRGRRCPPAVGTRALHVTVRSVQETLVLGGLLTALDAELGPDPSPALRAALAPEGTPPGRVPPPVYGSATTSRSLAAGGSPPSRRAARWRDELNLDPRRRIAAGLGAEVVRRHQDDLVAAVAEQIGDARAVNGFLDRARLARAVSTQLYERHVKPLDDHTLLQVAAPAGRAIQVAAAAGRAMPAPPRVETPLTPVTLQGMIATGPVPDGVIAPTFRQRTSPTGPDGPMGGIDPATIDPTLPERLREQLDPVPTIQAHTTERVVMPPRPSGADPLADALPAPRLQAPMYEALAAVAPDFVLTKADAIPPDSVVLLRVDRAAVAAFMCGLNHELSRELVWRGVPVDRGATFLRSFWDTRGQPGADHELAEIADWGADATLAELGGPAVTALAVRGDLLRRYPRTRVTAVRAKRSGAEFKPDNETVAQNTVNPAFTGFLPPDLRFFGFTVEEASLRSSKTDAGWFFALQEQATEAGFHGAAGTGDTAAEVASKAWRGPVRVLIHADALIIHADALAP